MTYAESTESAYGDSIAFMPFFDKRAFLEYAEDTGQSVYDNYSHPCFRADSGSNTRYIRLK